MEPIPVYARVLGTFLGIVAVPVLVFGVLAGTSSVLATTAQVQRTTTYDVGDAPVLRLDVQHSDVVVEAGADGRIVVDYEHSASSITRAAAGWAVNQTRVSMSHEANEVSVRETSSLNPIVPLNRSAELRVQVPARTDLDITCFGNLTVGRLDGNVRIRGRKGTTLRHVLLRNSSTVDGGPGTVQLDDVTVSGTASVKSRAGDILFSGSLAPGRNALNIDAGRQSNVSITLPHPTDARAIVATSTGNLNADPIWHFNPTRGPLTSTWSADLSANPSSAINVTTDQGNISFRAAEQR